MGSGAVAVAWSIAVSVVVAVERATCDWSPFQRMLALVLAVLLSMKAVVGAASRTPLSLPRWLLFCCWAGMDPRTFAVRAPRAGAGRLGREGLRHAALGVVVLALARLVPLGGLGTECAVFVGSSLVVHFGAFTLQAALLRALGYPAERLFRAPWRSRSLAEFWGQRWNLGFVEMTAIVLHRPLRRWLGCKGREGSRAARDPGLRALGDGACTSGPSGPESPSNRAGGASAGRRSAPTATKPSVAAPAALRTSCAIAVAFLFSGLLHECAITLPIHAGHGGPLAYFAWQGAAVCLEPRLRVRGPAWTLACLLLPLPLLFPAPFRAMVTGVLVG